MLFAREHPVFDGCGGPWYSLFTSTFPRVTWLVSPQPTTYRDFQTGHPLQVQVHINGYGIYIYMDVYGRVRIGREIFRPGSWTISLSQRARGMPTERFQLGVLFWLGGASPGRV